MEPSRSVGYQDTLTSLATNRPTNWQKQHHHSLSPKVLAQLQETQSQGDYRLPAGAITPACSLAPSAGSEIPPWRLRCVPREIRPRRCTPGLLMRPTQSTGSHLLLQKGATAPSDEARTLTECSGQPYNGKRLHQICRLVQEQRVLWKDLSSLLGDRDPRGTRNSPSLFILSHFLCHLSLSYMFTAG
ncbi:Uncharacterized protein HZ326_30630 [Fusarium oxysporum f. sp. albedinis]|nr:Uncharacterized protein HZ326_30630 [Fusarium oxysporum f. sp. albedinis]